MASLLHRIGLFSARKPWAVILSWLLLLGLVTGLAGTLSKPLSNVMTVDGLEFQDTLDTLKRELPDAAGGIGTVTFQSKTGTFTPEQKAAVAAATKEWEGQPAIAEARDPFVTQQQLDETHDKIAKGERDLTTNDKRLADGATQVADGKKLLATKTEELANGKTELSEALRKLADGEARLEAGKARVADGKAELAAGRRKLARGKEELENGKARLRDGEARLAAGKRKIAAAQAEIDAGKAKIAAAQDKIDGGKAKIAAARDKVESGEAQLAAARDKVESGEAELAAAKAKVADGNKQIAQAERPLEQMRGQLADVEKALQAPDLTDEQRAALQAQRDQLAAGIATAEKEIPAQKAAIAAAQDKIAAEEPRLAAAKEQIAAKTPEVEAGRARVDAESAKLRDAQRTLDAKRAELRQGQRTLDAKAAALPGSEAQLNQARRKVEAGESQIAAARAKLRRGERAMADAEAQIAANEGRLAAGRRKAEAGQLQITQGEQQLIAARDRLKASEQQIKDGRAKLEAGKVQLARGKRQAALTKGMRFVSADGTTAMTQLRFHSEMQSVSPEDRKKVLTVTDRLEDAGVTVNYAKELTDDVSSIMGPGEAIGVVVAGIVLFVMLGTFVAAGLPLVMALGGVGLGIGITMVATHFVTLNSTTPTLGLMLGIAVGIDYALFIVNRHREQLKLGMPKVDSIALATGTAGNAVTFAGMTVFIALAALAVTGMDFLATMGFAAATTVACAVLINLTLLPALMSLAGHRLLPRRVWRAHGFSARGESLQDEHQRDDEHLDRGWGAAVTRRPWLAIVASLALVGILGAPAAGLRLGLPDGGSEPADSTAYKTYATIGEKFGAGANGPIVAVATLPAGLTKEQATDKQLDVAEQLVRTDGLVRVVPFGLSADRRTAAFQAVPEAGPADERTVETVEAIRADAPAIKDRTGADLKVTGQTVANIDISAKLADALPIYLLIVVGLSLVLLLMVFRSVLVPLIATGGFLLSLVAAFGGVVAVYQHGHLGSLFGVHHPSAVLSFLPILLIGVLFGLAMDYQMFLVSGMREAHVHGMDARVAVRSGFSHAAAVVTAAAIIMVSVFAGFVHAHLTMIRPIGFGLALGVLIDAFVVRMTLTPAIMHLLGERAWWMPRWLQRVVPDVDVEGVRLVDKVEGHPHA